MAAKLTYDTTSTPKLIRINDGIESIDVQVDLYSDGKEDWVASDELAKFDFPYRTIGGDPISATQSVTAKFFLASGWQIKPYEADHELVLTGDLFSDNSPPEPLVTATSGNFTVLVSIDRSIDSVSTVVQTSGSTGGNGAVDVTAVGAGADNVRGPQFSWDLDRGEVPLIFDLQFNNVRVSGIATTVEVYRDSDDYVLDWNAGQFVASPSGNEHRGAMTELVANPGIYRRKFDPRNYGQTTDRQVYYMIYNGTVPSGFNNATADINVARSEIHKFSVPSGIGTGTGDVAMTANFIN